MCKSDVEIVRLVGDTQAVNFWTTKLEQRFTRSEEQQFQTRRQAALRAPRGPQGQRAGDEADAREPQRQHRPVTVERSELIHRSFSGRDSRSPRKKLLLRVKQ